MHKIETKIGLIQKAKGSSLFKCDNTTVICTVDFNNKHEQSKSEDYDKISLDIKYRNIVKKGFDTYYTFIIKKILMDCLLEVDKCKSVYINLFIDSTNSNTLWCSINALFLGLVECGVPLKDLLYASTGFTNKEDVFLYDKNGILIWYHAFCNIKDVDMTSVFDYYKYVKEKQDFTYKNNLIIKNI